MDRCIDLLPNWDLLERNLLPTFAVLSQQTIEQNDKKLNGKILSHCQHILVHKYPIYPIFVQMNVYRNEMKIVFCKNCSILIFHWNIGCYSLFATKHKALERLNFRGCCKLNDRREKGWGKGKILSSRRWKLHNATG